MSSIVEQLHPLYHARTTVMIGLSKRLMSVGSIVAQNIIDGGYTGKLYAVNPHSEKVYHDIKAYPQLRYIPEEVDLAVIVTPAQFVPEVMQDCVDNNVKTCILITAGFSEVRTPEGKKLEEEIVRIARRGKLRFTGGNCNGVSSISVSMHALLSPIRPNFGNVGIITQGGSPGVAMMGWTKKYRIGVSRYTNAGNEADVKIPELLEYYTHDPQTKVIMMYLEGIKDGRRFMDSAKKATRKKPLLLYKSGTSELGKKAAMAHVGALAGSNEICEAVFRQTGIIRTKSIDQMVGIAAAFSTQPLPKGRKVGILTIGGGWGVVTSDYLGEAGIEVPPLLEEEVQHLDQYLPPHWSRGNPIDTTDGAFDSKVLSEIMETLLKKENIDGAILIGPGMREAFGKIHYLPEIGELASQMEIQLAKELEKLLDKYQKPIIAIKIYAPEDSPAVEELKQRGIPVYETPQDGAAAYEALIKYYEYQKSSSN
ncbi:MAG: acetate--CoA ligase family protein [Candidatus Jordarchaeaceae archaeon]